MRIFLSFLIFFAALPYRSEGNADCVRRNMATLLQETRRPVSYEEFMKAVSEFRKADGKPAYIGHMKGEYYFVKEPVPQVKLHSGLHSNEGLEFFKRMRPDIAKQMEIVTQPGTGVQVLTLPQEAFEADRFAKLYQSKRIVNGKEIIFTKKTLFPKTWSEEEIIKVVNKIKSNRANLVRVEHKSEIMEGSYKNVKIRIVVQNNEVVTAFPLVN